MTATATTTYSSIEVCRMVGVSYRMLDYWIRTGAVTIPEPTPGSGRRRVWTASDVRRLEEIFAAYESAVMTVEAFRSGELWRAAS